MSDHVDRQHADDVSVPDFTQADDPFSLFESWFADAAASEPNDPNAMALATVDRDGLPDVRVVLLKGWDRRGFVFYTNLESAKGQELSVTPKAALNFHWKSLQRQVRLRGPVSSVSHEEADEYYASRPLGSRIGAWASLQSQPLASRAELEARVTELEATYSEDKPPQRPAHWSGFRVTPLQIEFWQDRPFRLHDRIVFRRESGNQTDWQGQRLYP